MAIPFPAIVICTLCLVVITICLIVLTFATHANFLWIIWVIGFCIIAGVANIIEWHNSAATKSLPTLYDTDNMSWFQKQFALSSKSRGSYLITDEVTRQLPEIQNYKVGLLNLFIQHTSCALSLNENWDEDVR